MTLNWEPLVNAVTTLTNTLQGQMYNFAQQTAGAAEVAGMMQLQLNVNIWSTVLTGGTTLIQGAQETNLTTVRNLKGQ